MQAPQTWRTLLVEDEVEKVEETVQTQEVP
jgi:hypothetical protein